MTSPKPEVETEAVRRVRFRAWRRGFREADLILGPFADAHAPAMTTPELESLERLLAESDHDLYAWIVSEEPAPGHVDAALLARLRGFKPPLAMGG